MIFEVIDDIKTLDLTKIKYKDVYKNDEVLDVFNQVSIYKELKEYKIQGNIAIVIYTNGVEDLKIIYKYKSFKEISIDITNPKTLDLSFHFIKDFALSDYDYKELFNFNAFFSVWIENAEITNVEVKNKVDFSYSRFYCNLEVICLNVENDASFKYVEFINSNVSFYRCGFNGQIIDFSNANFGNGKIVFECLSCKCMHLGETYFGIGKVILTVLCTNRFDISLAEIHSMEFEIYASFDQSTLNLKGCKIYNCVFKVAGYFNKSSVEIEYCDFINSDLKFDKCYLDNTKMDVCLSNISCILFKGIKFNDDVSLKSNKINKLKIIDCSIKSDFFIDTSYTEIGLGYDILSFEDTKVEGNVYIEWDRNNIFNAIEKGVSERIEESKNSEYGYYNPVEDRASQYRMLKNNFSRIGYYEDEDKALVKFMDNYLLIQNKKSLKIVKSFFSNIGGYGTEPISIFNFAILSIFVFASIYIFCGIEFTENFPKILENSSSLYREFVSALYFSGITFLTIGYGDVLPTNGWIMFATIAEGFFGVFTMSYFSVAVIRKILR